jgi:hypothetical protein
VRYRVALLSRTDAKRRRAKLPWYKDEDRHAVAYLEMTLRTRKRGRFPSIRQAAMLAACAKEGVLDRERTISGAPQNNIAPTGRRNSPVSPCLKNGYRELEISHLNRWLGGVALENCALRLRRKHRSWSKGNSLAKAWLHRMAQAWAAATYPHAVRRDFQQEPTAICQAAARAANESAFFQATLLPHLHVQESDEVNRIHCQSVSIHILTQAKQR